MARLHPDTEKARVIFASQSEEEFYRLCSELPDDWDVYYSCTLAGIDSSHGLVENEVDFVLYHRHYGLVVIEVKGGRISYDPDTQQFFTENRLGERFHIKSPFTQVLQWKSRFLRYLKKKDVRVPITHMVCLPSVYEKDFPERTDFDESLLLGRQKMENLEESIQEAVSRAQPSRYLQFKDVRETIDAILGGAHFSSRLYIRDYIDQHDSKVKDVEHIQETLISPIAGTRRLAIEGEAGTGKTMLAIALSKHFRDLGKKVAIMSPNPGLNRYVSEQVGSQVEVYSYVEFAAIFGIDIINIPDEYKDKREDWVQYIAPDLLREAILRSPLRYDVILCDEGQDVQPFWWESVEAALVGAESNFYIFFDRSQGVFGSGTSMSSFVPEDVLPISTPYFPLVHNYRNTKEINNFARNFRTGRQILNSYSSRLGYIPEVILYRDAAEAQVKLQVLLGDLCNREGLRLDELAILSARRPFQEGSIFYGTQNLGPYALKDFNVYEKRVRDDFNLPIATIGAFKGLETPVAIITNLSEYKLPLSHPILSSLLYVASTRAKHMLYIFLREDDPSRELVAKALASLSSKGALVIGEAAHDHLYSGTVSYFNPDRAGWLTVEDSVLEGSNLMFFPADVIEEDRMKVKVGSHCSFRVRREGYAAVAVDLRVLDKKPTLT